MSLNDNLFPETGTFPPQLQLFAPSDMPAPRPIRVDPWPPAIALERALQRLDRGEALAQLEHNTKEPYTKEMILAFLERIKERFKAKDVRPVDLDLGLEMMLPMLADDVFRAVVSVVHSGALRTLQMRCSQLISVHYPWPRELAKAVNRSQLKSLWIERMRVSGISALLDELDSRHLIELRIASIHETPVGFGGRESAELERAVLDLLASRRGRSLRNVWFRSLDPPLNRLSSRIRREIQPANFTLLGADLCWRSDRPVRETLPVSVLYHGKCISPSECFATKNMVNRNRELAERVHAAAHELFTNVEAVTAVGDSRLFDHLPPELLDRIFHFAYTDGGALSEQQAARVIASATQPPESQEPSRRSSPTFGEQSQSRDTRWLEDVGCVTWEFNSDNEWDEWRSREAGYLVGPDIFSGW